MSHMQNTVSFLIRGSRRITRYAFFCAGITIAFSAMAGECHIKDNYGRVGYTGSLVTISTDDATNVGFKLDNLRLEWVSSEARGQKQAVITSLRVVATKRKHAGERGVDIIWKNNLPLNIVLSEKKPIAKVDTVSISIPRSAVEQTDYVGLAFANNEELWPIDADLKLISTEVRELSGKCPIHTFPDE